MKPGTVVISNFPGIVTTKRRPAVVISTNAYHQQRPDVLLAAITSQIHKAISATDYTLLDWKSAGLNKTSAMRVFLFTIPIKEVKIIGELSERDWAEVQNRLRFSIEI